MLLWGRRAGQGIRIGLAEGVGRGTTVGELFSTGPIEIVMICIDRSVVRVGIQADPRLKILRSELLDKSGR